MPQRLEHGEEARDILVHRLLALRRRVAAVAEDGVVGQKRDEAVRIHDVDGCEQIGDPLGLVAHVNSSWLMCSGFRP
jgi:hypothetical protein